MTKQFLDLIGNNSLINIKTLSDKTGCEILVKMENRNPGGSIKDRPALSMITEAEKRGELRPGMTIVEGSAGNTGIGLAMIGKARGYKVKIVMPKGQAPEKERMLNLFGAEVILMDPVPFANQSHFYHTARKIAEENPGHWWANQFENTDNMLAHYKTTGPEIYQDTKGKIDYLVSVVGSGGTIAGCSTYLKEVKPSCQVVMADPEGSGLYSYFHQGEFKSQGSSITEGIGIMRLVANFKAAKVDQAIRQEDQLFVSLAYLLRESEGLVMGISSALNLSVALEVALKAGPGKTIVTFMCDGGERAASKLYNSQFLADKSLKTDLYNWEQLTQILETR